MLEQTANPSSDKKIAKPVAAPVIITETPFSKRRCCWFCGEPNNAQFIFPPHSSLSSYQSDQYLLLACPHPVISVPSCNECHKLAKKSLASSIWSVKAEVKRQLLKLYAKDLAIGINWTEQELASSDFEQGNFSGFARSAWFMYEVAKGRVNYLSWPLVADGIELDQTMAGAEQVEVFNFDGVAYPSLEDAITHYAKVFFLDRDYFTSVVQHLGNDNINVKTFAHAVRFCRLLVNASPNERQQAFKGLVASS